MVKIGHIFPDFGANCSTGAKTDCLEIPAWLSAINEFQFADSKPVTLCRQSAPCSRGFAYGTLYLSAQSARYPSYTRTEFRLPKISNCLSDYLNLSVLLQTVKIRQL